MSIFPGRCQVQACEWSRADAANDRSTRLCKTRLQFGLSGDSADARENERLCLSIRCMDFVKGRVDEARERALAEWLGEEET